jgi:ribosomal protein S18 acetylase RimI-like enzyme
MSKSDGFLLLRRPLSLPAPAPQWPEGVEVTALMASDATAIHRLLATSYAAGYGSVRADALDWWEAMITDSEFDRNLAFVAKMRGEMVGFCLVWTSSFIKDLVVDANCRRHGIGAALLSTAIEAMRARGAEEIALKVDIYNSTAQRLYRRFGFASEEAG